MRENTVEIKDEIYLNGQEFKLLSGAVHYFRIHPEEWSHSLYNLKALGLNTVETYVPWNLIEPEEGKFDQNQLEMLLNFIQVVDDYDLKLVLRASPYICSEWEFGGLPAWLLNEKDIRLRVDNPIYLEKVYNYYQYLLPQIKRYQYTCGGPIILMQLENEYGSYAQDKAYLSKLYHMHLEMGIEVPLFTADGTWEAALENGSLLEENIFVTGNFGSSSDENFDTLEKFFHDHGYEWPLICMEFWDGWFSVWGKSRVQRSAQDVANEARDIIRRGGINFYMFHGGTTFSLMNGCVVLDGIPYPQVNSYDYDALLNEEGNPTKKYYAVYEMLKEELPSIIQKKPRIKKIKKYPQLFQKAQQSLFDIIEFFKEPVYSDYPLTFEDLKNPYGYVLYRIKLKNYSGQDELRVINASDRIQIYENQKYKATQYLQTVGDVVKLDSKDEAVVDVLVENLGRINYGPYLDSDYQRKGIKGGILHDHQLQKGYWHYPLAFDEKFISSIDFNRELRTDSGPKFYLFELEIDETPQSTFIDCQKYGKGLIFVNGFNLGRYWSKGPVKHLYLPSGHLKQGINQIVVFETENVSIETLCFSDKTIFQEVEET